MNLLPHQNRLNLSPLRAAPRPAVRDTASRGWRGRDWWGALALVLALVSLPLAAADRSAPVLDLKGAIHLAIQHNLSVQNAYLGRIADRYGYRVAYDGYAPQVSVSGYTSTDSDFNDGARTLDNGAGLELTTTVKNRIGGEWAVTGSHDESFPEGDGQSFDNAMTLSYTQPLLQGAGRTVGSAPLTYADWQEESSVLSLKSTLMGVVNAVVEAYRSYLLAQRSLRLTRLSLERAERQLETNRELIAAERLAAVELVQSQADVAGQRLSLRSAENTVDAARVALLRLLRLPETAQPELSEVIEPQPLTLSVEQAEKIALANRPDFRLGEIARERGELDRKLARDAQRWQLDLSVQYQLASSGERLRESVDDLGQPRKGDYAVGVSLTVPIGSLSQKQQVVDAAVALAEARNNMVDLRESIRLELVDALRDIAIRWDEIALAEQSLELSRRQLELEREKLATGRSSSFQVISYQNQLLSTENQHLTAQIDYLNALTQLDASMGVTLQRWGIELLPDDQLDEHAVPRFQATSASLAGGDGTPWSAPAFPE
ncbi:TolC family protein [Endothiovibrio diazotrophicus]